MNSTYHFHIDDHHDHYHAGVETHKISAEQSTFHYSEHTEYQDDTGVISSILLIVLLFTSIVLSFLQLFPIKVIQFIPKITFCRYIFIDPPPIPIRYVLFHAPPTQHS
ncbi:hypothetical protein [Sulfurimonas sp. CS5]|jgi:hypothetical protein|uniref:hypothetical protein n=1 Tax=Sulfurimonas sp. CS5 TaxID=3391145 RepID=UPI0039EB6FA8